MERRSRKQWQRLIREFESSRLPAGEFARKTGIPVRSLYWWRWSLRRESRLAGREGLVARTPRVLPVEVVGSVAAVPLVATPNDARNTLVSIDVGVPGIVVSAAVGTDVGYVAAVVVELRRRGERSC